LGQVPGWRLFVLPNNKEITMVTVELVLKVLAALVGIPAVLALLIDVLKWAGVLADGDAGKVSAAFNLVALITVAVALQFFPSVNVKGIDEQLMEVVKFAALIFQYVIQIVDTKAFHKLYAMKVKAFSHAKAPPMLYVGEGQG
jgi:hypothetical protein